jgi:acid phosphatase type 7
MKTTRGRFRAAMLMGASASVLAFTTGANAQQVTRQTEQVLRHEQAVAAGANAQTWPYAIITGTPPPPPPLITPSPVLAVVGDISCQPGTEAAGEASNEVCSDPASPYTATSLWQSQVATANQIKSMQPDLVALVGDLQYQVARYSDFEQSFDWTYGYFKSLHRPAPGNHEFYDEHGETGVGGYGYFAYYNGFQIDATSGMPLMATISDPCPVPNSSCKAGKTPVADLSPQPIPNAYGQAGYFEPTGGLETATYYNGPLAGTAAPTGVGDGWYSYNVGSWHLISLNIECYTQPGGCSTTGSWFAAELAWLKNDLETNRSFCTAAYWHQPTFSPTNGITNEGIAAQAFWQLLYQYGADLVLNGHDHLYAHYRPLNPSGSYDPINGIREFVVGTGGETLDPVVTATVASGPNETNMEDPFGNPSFNALNLEAGATGDYWGVMALTLNPVGYAWDFESALEAPLPGAPASPTFSDKGVGSCHGGH